MARMLSTFAHRPAARWLAGAALCAGLLGGDGWLRPAALPPARATWPAQGQLVADTPIMRSAGTIPMPEGVPAAHASALLALPATGDSALLACWFAGTRESAPDVRIVGSEFSRSRQAWQAAHTLVDRGEAGRALGFGLRRLGNPVPWRDARGRLHLFVVATGAGGWAAGRILHLRQGGTAPGDTPDSLLPLRVLPLSWLWNISHLVRATPLPLADGGMVLPAYFELGRKYPVALRFDADGRFRGMVRMSRRSYVLQPTLLARTATDWVALLRDSSSGRRLLAVQTRDGGRHWQDLPDPGMPNPDAAVAGLAVTPQRMFLAHNPQPESRERLVLSASADALHWHLLQDLAQGGPGSEYSYPSLAWADGSLWVSYTDQRKDIAWQRFTFVPGPAR